MSTERNVEAVGCDASIMKNVWEIREREYKQKMMKEKERAEKSALKSINEDWANRLTAKMGIHKRVGRKKRAEVPVDDSNVWKSKSEARSAPRPGPTPTRRPTPQRGMASQPKDKKVPEKGSKLHLLKSLKDMQPSTMVWGKSWKFTKDMPKLEEGATFPSDWGQCWMFLTQQPYTEPGKPWSNGPCQINPSTLHLFEKPVFREADSENLDWDFSSDKWNMSWKNGNKENKESALRRGYGFFAALIESHHNNVNMYNSGWSEGWMSTKPSKNESMEEVFNVEATKQASGGQVTSEWSDSWKLGNHHGLSKMPGVRKTINPEWVNSWRAAMMVQNNNASQSSSEEGHANDPHKAKEIVFVTNKNKRINLFSKLDEEIQVLSEWDKSWQVSKNDSKPSTEIEKTLKMEPPKMEGAPKVQEKPNMVSVQTSEEASGFAQLKNIVLFRPRKEVTHSVLSHLKHLEKTSSGLEWKDSWKMLKHQLKTERRRMRVDPLKPFGEKREKMMPSTSEWKDSWKITNPTVGQNVEMWQQQWTTTPQICVDRARECDHFAPVVLPKNGPKGERSWNESWRWSRHQIEQRGSAAAPSHATTSQHSQRPHITSPGDWQDAWMFSESQYRRDKPSYTQWMEAWKTSAFQTGIHPCNELITGERWFSESLEIKRQKEVFSEQKAKTKMSRSFEMSMFRERYPEKQWVESWKVGSMLKECAVGGDATVQHKMGVSNEYGCKWGMSFRLANPMPKMDQPWVKSSGNPCYYAVKWPRRKIHHTSINAEFTNNPRIPKLWNNSQQFLQSFSAKPAGGKSKPSAPVDPRVIYSRMINLKKHLYVNLKKKEKQMEKKWAGCHSLAKTQPKPRKGEKRVKLEDEEGGDKFLEEWGESWRFLVKANGPKKAVKSLAGWEEAWKCLIPLYLMPKAAKAARGK